MGKRGHGHAPQQQQIVFDSDSADDGTPHSEPAAAAAKACTGSDWKLQFASFGSGSSGNCSYLGTSDGGVLIDAGVDPDHVFESLRRNGVTPSMIKGIVLTHDHADHIRYAYTIVRRYKHLRIYCTPRLMSGVLRHRCISRRIKEYQENVFKEIPFKLGEFTFTAFEVSHDATDNMGFMIEAEGKRFVVANRVLMKLFVTRAFRNDPEVLALVRSTIVPTMVDGSFPAKNILPSTARAFFNARLLPGDTPEKLLKYVKELLADLPVEVELLYAGEESFTTSRKTPMYRLLRSTLEELYPQLPCIPTLMTMSSDARHYSDLSDCILRFAPLTLGKEGGGGTHGPDEFVSEPSLGLAAEFYQALIRKL